jgi:hypothetical protein
MATANTTTLGMQTNPESKRKEIAPFKIPPIYTGAFVDLAIAATVSLCLFQMQISGVL